MNDAFVSYTVHAGNSTEARKKRLMREAGFFDRETETSPIHLALLVAIVVSVLGGATALVDDGSMKPAAIEAARIASR